MIARLAVIGVGLIGGSLARALRAAGAVGEVVGAGRGTPNLIEAQSLGIVDRWTTDPAAAVAGADMVVIGASLGATAGIFASIAPALGPATIVTDVGSTKGSVVTEARALLGTHLARFVPGHPIAGTEHSGARAAFAELFTGHKVILTPLAETDRAATAGVRAMWELAGATVVEMDVAAHDDALAATSHLPHLLAFNLVDTLAAADGAAAIFEFAAGGFRDFTRIASSNPEMWRDIVLANRDALRAVSTRYIERLERLLAAIERGDGAAIEQCFRRAKAARDGAQLPTANGR